MTFSVADLLDQLPSGAPLTISKLGRNLGLSGKEARHELDMALAALSRVGLIALGEKEVERRDDGSFLAARLRCSSKGFCFALREDGGEDVYIRDQHLNHAWNGDRVLITVHREGGRRRSPEGIVHCILERQTGSVLAQVEAREDGSVAVPLDDRIPARIHLEDAADEGEPGSVVEVAVDRYPIGQFPAHGHVVRRLPLNGGPEVDREILLTRHNLQDRSAPPRTTLRHPAERDREDLTHQKPLLLREWLGDGAPELPAVWFEEKEGATLLWVHAPCLAEHLRFGGALDQWMRHAGEAFCLGDEWRSLTTPALNKATGFRAGEAQGSLSVCLELAEDGRVEHFRFCRGLIRPAAVVDAAALEALRARKPRSRTLATPLKPLKDHLGQLAGLLEISERLRGRRLAEGSFELSIDRPDLEELGDLLRPFPDGSHEGWRPGDGQRGPHALLAELIQPAHEALARHLQALGLPGLRAHRPAPEAGAVNDVAKAAISLDLPLELDEDGNAPDLQTLAEAFRASERASVLQQQLASVVPPVELRAGSGTAEPQEPSQPSPAEDALSPWCCPALHYADLFNQHLLATLLREGKDRPTVRHKTRVDLGSDSCHGAVEWPVLTAAMLSPFQQAAETSLVPRLNTRRRQVAELRRDAIQMAQARLAEPLVGTTLAGRISGIQSYGFFVEIPPAMIEGLVHVSSLRDDWYEYRSRQSRLVGRKNRRVYRLGDAVEVLVEKVDVLRNQIDLSVPAASCEAEPSGESEGESEAGAEAAGET
jgi:ribonuclease R